MKQLIQPIYKECVYYKNQKDNKIIILEKHKVYGKLIYTELSETKRETINNIDEIPHCTYQGFIKKNRGRKYFEYYYDKLKRYSDDYYKVVWEENFIMMTKTMEYEIEDEKNYTLERLMRNLSANDMIEYMRDRGMAYCPMIK
jgi:hypothetical protein